MPATDPLAHDDVRPLRPAILRGWRRRCPHCGKGALLSGYLSVHDHCSVCNEDFHHHRADDGPAYATVLIVGHLLVPLLLIVFIRFRPEPLVLATLFSGLAIGLSLYLLPRLKGVFIAFQWSRRMHGFGGGPDGSAQHDDIRH